MQPNKLSDLPPLLFPDPASLVTVSLALALILPLHDPANLISAALFFMFFHKCPMHSLCSTPGYK